MSDKAPSAATPENEIAKFVAFDGQTDEDTAKTDTEESENKPEEKAEEPEEKTAEAAESEYSEEAEEKEDESDEDAPPPKKGKPTAHDRIRQLARKRRQTEAELAAERAERLKLEAQIESLKKKGLTPESSDVTLDDDKEPDPTDEKKYPYGELDKNFIRDLSRYEARKEHRALEAKQAEERKREAAAREAQDFAERGKAFVEAGSRKYDDFDEVVIEGIRNQEFPVSRDLAVLILSNQEVGPDVAYHLASHVDEAQKVFRQSPLEQAAYFGRLAERFSATSGAAASHAVKTTKAPPPPDTRVKGAGSKTGFSPKTATFEEFEAHVRASQARK